MEENRPQNFMPVDEADPPQSNPDKEANKGVSDEDIYKFVSDKDIDKLLGLHPTLDGTYEGGGGGGGNSNVTNYIKGLIYDLIKTKFFKNFNEVNAFLKDTKFIKFCDYFFTEKKTLILVNSLINIFNQYKTKVNDKEAIDYIDNILKALNDIKNSLSNKDKDLQVGGDDGVSSSSKINLKPYLWKPDAYSRREATGDPIFSMIENYFNRSFPDSRKSIYSHYRGFNYRFGNLLKTLRNLHYKPEIIKSIEKLGFISHLIHAIKCTTIKVPAKLLLTTGKISANTGGNGIEQLVAAMLFIIAAGGETVIFATGANLSGFGSLIIIVPSIITVINHYISASKHNYDSNNITNLKDKNKKLCYFKTPIQLFNILHTYYNKKFLQCSYIVITDTLKENIKLYVEELNKKLIYLYTIFIINLIISAKKINVTTEGAEKLNKKNHDKFLSHIKDIKDEKTMYRFITVHFMVYISDAKHILNKNNNIYINIIKDYKIYDIEYLEKKIRDLITENLTNINNLNKFIEDLNKRSEINAQYTIHDIFVYNANNPSIKNSNGQTYCVSLSPESLFKKIHSTMDQYNVYSMNDINFSGNITSLNDHFLRVPHKFLDGKERINYKTFLFIDDILLYIKECANLQDGSFEIIYDLYLIMIEDMYKLLYNKDKSNLIGEYTDYIEKAITGSGEYETPKYGSNNIILKNNKFILDIIINLETLVKSDKTDISKLKKIELPKFYENELKKETKNFTKTFGLVITRNLFNELIEKIKEKKPTNQNLIDNIIEGIKETEAIIYKILKFRSRTLKSEIRIIRSSYSWIDGMLLSDSVNKEGIMYEIFNSFNYTENNHDFYLHDIYDKIYNKIE